MIFQGREQSTLLQNSKYLSNMQCRHLSTSQILNKIVAFKLSDIGEGIREVVIKEW